MKLEADIDWNILVKSTDGYSGADISNVCREASLIPFRNLLLEHTNIEDIASRQSQIDVPLTMAHFVIALKNISKSVSTEFLHKYSKWMKDFGAV
jgi:katanin p60 ATPase-containing subunit A1